MISSTRTMISTVLGVTAAGCAPAGPVGEAAAVAELAGRDAGTPQRCVPTQLTGAMRIAAPRLILYGSGRTVWANRLSGPCPGMDSKYSLIVEPFGAQYCRGDRVRIVEPISGIAGPACTLGDFVPYTR